MPKDPIANLLRGRGYRFIALGQYEEALRCFQNALGIDPQISVAFRNQEEMEKFIREGRSETFIKQAEQQEEKKQREIDVIGLWHIQNEAKLQRAREEERRKREEEEAKARIKRQEESQRLAFNSNLSQFIRELESCADEKPCPKCNELAVFILSLSPNARSVLAQCKHCHHEYRIKMEPADPQKILSLFNSFMENRRAFADTENALPIWEMKIIQRRTTNQRTPIPSDVKKAVWKRDEGKCVNCGSEVDLEYDHIIPVAKGGSSTVQNIQILCQVCNRKKHASIS